MTSIIFHTASKNFNPRGDSPKFEVDLDALEDSFKCGRKGEAFELGWFDKLMAFFSWGNTPKSRDRVARELLHDFGMTVRKFIQTDNFNEKRDCKQHAIEIAGQLRKRVHEGTLKEFDKLINPKLALLVFDDADASADLAEVDERDAAPASEIPAYPNPGASLSPQDEQDLYGAFYAKPELYLPSDASGVAGDPTPSVLSASISSSQSFDSGNSFQFMDLHADSMRRDEILNPSKPALPIPTIPVSPVKAEPAAISDSPALPDVPVSMDGSASSSHGIGAQARHLLHEAAEKMEGFVEDVGRKFDQLGERAHGVFGGHAKPEDNTKSTAPVDIAIAVMAVDEAPVELIARPDIRPAVPIVDHPKAASASLDQAMEADEDESEVNPFALAEEDSSEFNQRAEKQVQEIEALVKAAELRAETLEKAKETQEPPLADPSSERIDGFHSAPQAELATPHVETVLSTIPAHPEPIGPHLKDKVKEGAVKVVEMAGAAWQQTAGIRRITAEFGSDVAEKGVEAFSSGAKWLAEQSKNPKLKQAGNKITSVFKKMGSPEKGK